MRATGVAGRLGAFVSVWAVSSTLAYGFDIPNPLAKVFGGGQESKPAEPGRPAPPTSALGIDCPEILVDGGTSFIRVPAGADSASVRYQLSLGTMARECSVQDDKLQIKVGVEGAAVLGPAGQAGSFSGALRVSARRQKDEAILQSRTYHVSATVASGATRGEFRMVAEPLIVPYTGPHAADDYEILVGFDQGGAAKAEAPKRHKRRAQRPQQEQQPQ